MKNFDGTWLPDHEQHLVDWMTRINVRVDGRLAYQWHKQLPCYEAVAQYRPQFRRAIDVGGHCGLWARHMATRFRMTEAFEPVADHRACFERNVDMAKCRLWPLALGEADGLVRMETAPSSSGDTRVGGAGDIPMRRLDDVLPDADDVDFMKIDAEGFELFILRGGEQLIRRNRPVVCVEQKPGRGQRFQQGERDAVVFLQSLGAVLRKEMSGDFILSWED